MRRLTGHRDNLPNIPIYPAFRIGLRPSSRQVEGVIAEKAQWKNPEDVKKSHPKASILKSGRVVFNIKANDFRLIALVQYQNGILMIRFFGSHEEYDKVDAETV